MLESRDSVGSGFNLKFQRQRYQKHLLLGYKMFEKKFCLVIPVIYSQHSARKETLISTIQFQNVHNSFLGGRFMRTLKCSSYWDLEDLNVFQ